MNKYISLIIYFFLSCQAAAEIPADISFIVIDLKYNSNDGVKICELQEGLPSFFTAGTLFLDGDKDLVSDKVGEFLSSYFQKVWFVRSGLSGEFKSAFKSFNGWKGFSSFKKMMSNSRLKKAGKKRPLYPEFLEGYRGLIVCNSRLLDPKKLDNTPGLLLLNRAFQPVFKPGFGVDKSKVNSLFDEDETLRSLRPSWRLYPKRSSDSLVSRIHEDFASEYLVIKPRKACQGNGVIILRSEDLQAILGYIFSGSSDLARDPDKGYNWWAEDPASDFIVEEFVPSDPVYAHHLSDYPFDGTMRAAIMLTFEKEIMGFHLLYLFWKLPKKSLGDAAGLTDKHKSFSQSRLNYAHVDPETENRVRQQLEEGLFLLYDKFLGH